jgi:biotin transport system substrate-specific component
MVQKRRKASFYYLLFLSFAAVSLPYIPGLVYLWVIMKFIVQAQISFGYTLKTGFLPFIGGDILKAIVVFLIVWKAKPLRGK